MGGRSVFKVAITYCVTLSKKSYGALDLSVHKQSSTLHSRMKDNVRNIVFSGNISP